MPDAALSIIPVTTDDGTVIVLEGEADLRSSGLLVNTLARMIPYGTTTLTVDAARLTFCDSAGLAALVAVAASLRRDHGLLTLLHPGEALLRVLEITGADTLMNVQP
jgi:anti-anti-sigma factor